MSYSEYEEEIDEGFKLGGMDEDEPLDPMEEMPPEEEQPELDDPDSRYH